MKKPQEIALQARCVRAFNNAYCLVPHTPRLVIYSTPNEVSSGTKAQRALEIQQKVASGMLGGVGDLTILGTKGRMFYIELKLPHNNQQPNQIDFEKRVTELGFPYYVAKSELEFTAVVEKQLTEWEIPLKQMHFK